MKKTYDTSSFLRRVYALYDITKNQGLFTATKRSIDYLEYTLPMVMSTKSRYLKYRSQGYSALAAPYKIINISPQDVTHYSPPSTFNEHYRYNFGKIKDGNWDRNAIPIEEQAKYKACQKRVIEDIPWRETGIIDRMYSRLQESEKDTIEHGCSSRQDIIDLYENQREELYQSLKKEGFRRDISKTSCRLHIGHDGKLIFASGGRHTFFLSRIIGIDEVPVKILIRHEKWQEIREEVNQTDHYDELSERAKKYLEHPDLRDIINKEWPV